MERLKRIDEKLMKWITARPYGYKLERKKHSRSIVLITILAIFMTIDALIYGWSFPNVLCILLCYPSAFYESRLWLRLRASEEMEDGTGRRIEQR